MTYTLIDSVTLTSSASSVTFSSIPQTYGDLVLTYELLGVGGIASVGHRLNADSGSNYSYVRMAGNGSTSISGSGSLDSMTISANAYPTTTTKGMGSTQFMDYSATDKHKSALSRANNAEIGTMASALRWANTAAITSIESFAFSNSWAAGGTVNLYGIAKAL